MKPFARARTGAQTPDAAQLAARYPKTHRIDPTLGLQKHCAPCDEWWPATREFFSTARRSPTGLHSTCHACETERMRRSRSAAK